MSLSLFLFLSIVGCLLGFIFAPFPYWPTYFRLWGYVMFKKSTPSAKYRQVLFLLSASVRVPLWTVLWYLDELLYPEYRQREIVPVFIIGQPRCGTTFLHRTLARDSLNFFAARHLEWRYPFICIHKLINWLQLEKKLGEASYWPKSDAGELAAKMHTNRLMDWEEDGIFFEENFLHHFFIYLRFPYQGLLPHLDTFSTLSASTQGKMLMAHQKTLKKIAYLHNVQSQLYLSKEVTSHNKIPMLLQLYPEARFLVVARASSHFMPSLMALVRMSTWSKTEIDPLTLPYWHDSFVSRMREDSLRLIDICEKVIPEDRQLRVAAEDVINHPSATIGTIYRELALPISLEVADKLKELDSRQAARDRGYQYEPYRPEGFEEYDRFVAINNEKFRAKRMELPTDFDRNAHC